MKRSQRKKYKGLDPSGNSSSEEQKAHSNTDIDIKEQTNIIHTKNVFGKYNEKNILLNMWLWIKDNPKSKLPFLYFVISSIVFLVLGIFYLIDSNSAFFLSGLFGVVTACYALIHFRTLLMLKKEIDSFYNFNKQFKRENIEAKQAVQRLTRVQNELKTIHSDIQDINARTKQNNMKFRQIEENLNAVNLNAVEGITTIRAKVTQISEHWKESLVERERKVIFNVYDRLADSDIKSGGVNREEFDYFAELLPDAYRERFDRLGTFSKLAAGKSVIDLDDLRVCLDVFAEMDVDDCDIEFEIHRIPSSKQDADDNDDILSPFDAERPQLIRRQITVTRRSQPGTHFLDKHKD